MFLGMIGELKCKKEAKCVKVGLIGTCIFITSFTMVQTNVDALTHGTVQSTSTYSIPSVNAKTHRVWHVIPGLNGWELDEQGTKRATSAANDGLVHPVWNLTKPAVSLATLPPEPIYRGPSEEKSTCLMFNVSWGEAYIPGILKVLREKNVKATFFLDGAWVRSNPELAREIADAGHIIGSHGTGHPDFAKISNVVLAKQVVGTNKIISHNLGVKPILLAPPAGAYDDRTVQMAHRHGMYTILWTTDTIDWRKPPAGVIVDRVKNGLEPGALILMHPTQPTMEALPAVIDAIFAKGYQIKTVEDVVQERRVKPPSVLE